MHFFKPVGAEIFIKDLREVIENIVPKFLSKYLGKGRMFKRILKKEVYLKAIYLASISVAKGILCDV